MTYPQVQAGDIVIKYRPVYEGWFNYLLQRSIAFFTTEYWLNEKHSVTSHAELVTMQIGPEDYEVIDEEPPAVSFKNRGYNRRIIFRLKTKPANFNEQFQQYIKDVYGKKYAYLTIFLFILNWLFRTRWFTKTFHIPHTYVCSGAAAFFYEMYIGISIAAVHYDSAAPDDLYDFCKMHSDLVELIWDGWSEK